MTENLRAGRLSYAERDIILQTLGTLAQEKYDEEVTHNQYGYNLSLLKGSLQYESDLIAFENYYYLENPDPELNDLAHYFEYGTGLFNTKNRRGPIIPVTKSILKFRKEWNGIMFARQVKGVRPIFAFTTTVQYMRQNRQHLQREIRLTNGI